MRYYNCIRCNLPRSLDEKARAYESPPSPSPSSVPAHPFAVLYAPGSERWETSLMRCDVQRAVKSVKGAYKNFLVSSKWYIHFCQIHSIINIRYIIISIIVKALLPIIAMDHLNIIGKDEPIDRSFLGAYSKLRRQLPISFVIKLN